MVLSPNSAGRPLSSLLRRSSDYLRAREKGEKRGPKNIVSVTLMSEICVFEMP